MSQKPFCKNQQGEKIGTHVVSLDGYSWKRKSMFGCEIEHSSQDCLQADEDPRVGMDGGEGGGECLFIREMFFTLW